MGYSDQLQILVYTSSGWEHCDTTSHSQPIWTIYDGCRGKVASKIKLKVASSKKISNCGIIVFAVDLQPDLGSGYNFEIGSCSTSAEIDFNTFTCTPSSSSCDLTYTFSSTTGSYSEVSGLSWTPGSSKITVACDSPFLLNNEMELSFYIRGDSISDTEAYSDLVKIKNIMYVSVT